MGLLICWGLLGLGLFRVCDVFGSVQVRFRCILIWSNSSVCCIRVCSNSVEISYVQVQFIMIILSISRHSSHVHVDLNELDLVRSC